MDKNAIWRAPMAIFPVILLIHFTYSVCDGDLREAIASPFVAFAFAFVGYPVALVGGFLSRKILSRLEKIHTLALLAYTTLLTEIFFWALINPFWHPQNPNWYWALVAGACGLACGVSYKYLIYKQKNRAH